MYVGPNMLFALYIVAKNYNFVSIMSWLEMIIEDP